MTSPKTGTITTPDGFQLHTAQWDVGADPKALVILVHGYGEHHGRYLHVIEALNNAGYAVYTLDHRGHGKSSGERAYFENFDEPLNDLRQYIDLMQTRFPSEKVFMLGHSMGALMSMIFALKYQNELNGLIISGIPINGDKAVSPALITIAKVLNRIVPKAQLADTAPITELSTDPTVATAFAADPLTFKGKMRVRMGVSINQGAAWSRENMATLKLPVLIMHGTDDKICPPSGSKFVYDHATSTDKTIKLYTGMKHEIFNEVGRAAVLNDTIAWLDQRSNLP